MAGIVNSDTVFGPACDVLGLHVVHAYRFRPPAPGTPAPEWQVSAGLTLAKTSDPVVVHVTGTAVGESTLSAKVTTDKGPVSVSLKITIVSVDHIEALFVATPSLRANNAQLLAVVRKQRTDLKLGGSISDRVMPAFHSTTDSSDAGAFSEHDAVASILFVLRGDMSQRLQVQANTHGKTLSWNVERNATDDATIRTPATPTLDAQGNSATLHQNATGAFAVRAYVPCACQKMHAGRLLKVVMIQVKLLKDQSTTNGGYFPTSQNGLTYDYSRHETDTATGTPAIDLHTSFTVLSGGPTAQLFLDQDVVSACWFNNELPTAEGLGACVSGDYVTQKGTRRVVPVATLNSHKPYVDTDYYRLMPDDLKLPHSPLLDTGDDVSVPQHINLAGSSAVLHAEQNSKGHTLTVTVNDMPNQPLALFFPKPTGFKQSDLQTKTALDEHSPLKAFTIDYHFCAGVALWTSSVPWRYGVVYQVPWAIGAKWALTESEGKFTSTVVTPRFVHSGPNVDHSAAVKEAHAAGMEVWSPATMNHIGRLIIET